MVVGIKTPKDNTPELDTKKLNDVIGLSRKILKIAYILMALAAVYAFLLLIKELHILSFIVTIFKVAAPLFIGVGIAWLFDPFVTSLNKRKINRVWATTITYILLVGGLFLIIGTIIPLLSNQTSELVQNIPSIFDWFKGIIDNVFNGLKNIKNFDSLALKSDIFIKLEEIGSSLANQLPNILVSFVTSFISGLGTILVGLIIGFYLLLSFGHVKLPDMLPINLRKESKKLLNEIDLSLRRFVRGAFYDSLVVFVITSILFWIVGLKAPLLFGLFCGITNVIPFAGPYIGGTPAIIFGFSQNPTIGLLTLLVVIVVQFIEGNFFQPVIMSKSTKLHPVSIILGLLVFGHFFGIVGMFISTPVISVLKVIFKFLNNKYDFLNFYN